ncbi:putative pentachlorophenol 4-monooxygenase [Cladophialophora carrionii]|uniref:Putative pentachlorophenol 4-monooxygenase n=1 Tax=Cladophialophora carrionii TaxID=86049 RepID=A0A1C1CNA2_9EURO|nr:putative pentachlorophenol 4-monooxygenase [Cladophialophora carrionii]
MNTFYDVIVAGAGPVGLFLACELAVAGVSVLVLEQQESPESPWKVGLHGTRGLHIHSIEAFYRRGLLDKVLHNIDVPGHVAKVPGYDLNFAAHFASIRLDPKNADFARWKYHLPLPQPAEAKLFYPAPTSVDTLEKTLAERAESLGVRILRGVEFTDFTEESETVTVLARDHTFTAKWLVGCDGERSKVREAAQFEFPGTPAEFRGYVVHCDLANPEVLQRGFCRTAAGMYIFPAPGHLYVTDFETLGLKGGDEAITREHFESVLRRVSQTEIVVTELHRAMSMTTHLKQTTTYRKGRVLLAGDSAHVHPSFGAQGLSIGIGDAMNLGWKLAATVRGIASPELLDSYNQERHPEGARQLEWARVQLSLLRSNPYSLATAKLMKDLIATKDGNTFFIEHIVGLAKLYNLGNAHPAIGYSAPDFELADGSRLGAKMRQAPFLVVDFTDNHAVANYVQSLGSAVTYSGSQPKDAIDLKALIVRPDGVIAWASADKIELTELKTELGRWLDLSKLETDATAALMTRMTLKNEAEVSVTAIPIAATVAA